MREGEGERERVRRYKGKRDLCHDRLVSSLTAGVVESLKIVTREKSQRIAKYAFDYATHHQRKRVTAIHKANIM